MYANVLHIPAPSPEEGVASMSISIAYLQAMNSWQKQHDWER